MNEIKTIEELRIYFTLFYFFTQKSKKLYTYLSTNVCI